MQFRITLYSYNKVKYIFQNKYEIEDYDNFALQQILSPNEVSFIIRLKEKCNQIQTPVAGTGIPQQSQIIIENKVKASCEQEQSQWEAGYDQP